MHAIDIRNSEHRFAYSAPNGGTWHGLGTKVEGYGTVKEMLTASLSDWQVEKQPVYITAADGITPIKVDDKYATVRVEHMLDADGVHTDYHPLGIVGNLYTVEQNEDAAYWALDLVGASQGDAVIDTMGVLHGGKEFFVGVDVGTIVLDPEGIGDVIKRYLIVRNRHDGTSGLTAFPTMTRVVCHNTLTAAWGGAKRNNEVVTLKHTKNKDTRKMQAVEAMGLAQRIRDQFVEAAERMLTIDGGHDVLDKVIHTVWPKPEVKDGPRGTRGITMWSDRRRAIHDIYDRPTNSGQFGDSGWTVWNAVGEYLDHKGKDLQKRAAQQMDPASETARIKNAAYQRLLTLAGV